LGSTSNSESGKRDGAPNVLPDAETELALGGGGVRKVDLGRGGVEEVALEGGRDREVALEGGGV